ncbi:MAG: hypothetical protein A2X35_00180 [Elusimicrobia bacterium GWA2_61_42]|nr:MAG: hypothetical protein A2X35_00180 [Elusimicrobia bacterium GWA2_61_42]OGR74514.1 MAG: hypothetical protein A2X38_07930 [Elusimicrobia bacterium GWC2_61_25]
MRSRFSIWAIVAANLLPLVLVALGYWGVTEILALYWIETAIVGFFTVLKVFFASAPVPYHKTVTFEMLKSAPHLKTLPLLAGDLGFIGKILISLFFAFPFIMFMALNGLILYLALVLVYPGASVPPLLSLKWGLLSLFLGHGAAFAADYLASGEFRRTRPGDCVNEPFHRLAIMQLTLAAGAGLSGSFGGMLYIMSVFVVAKLAIELRPPGGYIGAAAETPKTDASAR